MEYNFNTYWIEYVNGVVLKKTRIIPIVVKFSFSHIIYIHEYFKNIFGMNYDKFCNEYYIIPSVGIILKNKLNIQFDIFSGSNHCNFPTAYTAHFH